MFYFVQVFRKSPGGGASYYKHTFTTFAARRSLSPSADRTFHHRRRTVAPRVLPPTFRADRSMISRFFGSRDPQRAAAAAATLSHESRCVDDSDVARDREGTHDQSGPGRSSRPPRTYLHDRRSMNGRERATSSRASGDFSIQAPSFADGKRSRSLAAASTSVPLAGTTRCSVMILCENVAGEGCEHASPSSDPRLSFFRLSRSRAVEFNGRHGGRDVELIGPACGSPRTRWKDVLSPFACAIFLRRGCGRSDDGAT